MLVGLARFALIRRVREAEIANLPLHLLGETRRVEHHVLKSGGEVDLDSIALRKFVEDGFGQRRRAVLHRTGDAVFLSADLGGFPQDFEIDLRLSDAAIGERNAAMRGAGLHRDLADAGLISDPLQEAVHVGAHFIGLRVVLADFTDLAADRNRDSLRLPRPNVLRKVRGALVVRTLLFFAALKTQID